MKCLCLGANGIETSQWSRELECCTEDGLGVEVRRVPWQQAHGKLNNLECWLTINNN